MTVSFDPFAPETDEYSQEKFYTKTEDTHHHSSTLRWGTEKGDIFAVPKTTVQRMAAIKEACPQLRTNMDVMRDALIHYFHMRAVQLRGQLPAEWLEDLDLMTQTAAVDRMIARKKQHDALLEKIDGFLRDATSSKEERLDAVRVCERAAISFVLPEYIRRANDIIDRYRYV